MLEKCLSKYKWKPNGINWRQSSTWDLEFNPETETLTGTYEMDKEVKNQKLN